MGMYIRVIGLLTTNVYVFFPPPPPKTKMAMENPPLQDVFLLNMGISQFHVSFRGVYGIYLKNVEIGV